MTVLETRSQAGSTVRWSEICGPQHHSAAFALGFEKAVAGSSPDRLTRVRRNPRNVARPATRVERQPRAAVAGSSPGSVRPARGVSVGRGRQVPARVISADRPRACQVNTAAAAKVTDDVPTWVLLTCGIVFGVMLLLAMAFIGGTSYA